MKLISLIKKKTLLLGGIQQLLGQNFAIFTKLKYSKKTKNLDSVLHIVQCTYLKNLICIYRIYSSFTQIKFFFLVSGKHKPHYFVFVRLSLDRHRNNLWKSKAETKKYVIPKEIEVFTIFLSKVMGSDGFCNRTNLIYFQKQTIAGFFVNGHLNSFWVGNSQIVSNNLNISWTSQFCPSFPIILEKIETF